MNTPAPEPSDPGVAAQGAARIWAPPASPNRPVLGTRSPSPAPPVHRPLGGLHREAEVRRRARGDAFGPVDDALRVSVAIAVCHAPDALSALVESLAAQRDGRGSPFVRGEAEALVALVGAGAAVGAELAARHPWLRTTAVPRLPAGAGPEWACQLAMDAACVRLLAAGRPEGLVLTTARPQRPDWLARAAAAAADGVDVLLAAPLDLDAGLAVTARAYAHVGGLRVACPSPAAALAAALSAAGARVSGGNAAEPPRPALALSS